MKSGDHFLDKVANSFHFKGAATSVRQLSGQINGRREILII